MTESSSSSASSTVAQASPSVLQTSQGNTTIADGVVQKIAGLATREVAGVFALGGGAARAFGAIREVEGEYTDPPPHFEKSAAGGVLAELEKRWQRLDR